MVDLEPIYSELKEIRSLLVAALSEKKSTAPAQPSAWLCMADAARYTGLSYRTLQKRIQDPANGIITRKIGNFKNAKVMVQRASLENYIKP